MESFLIFLSDLLLILVMLLSAKTIYDDSIKIDKVTGIILLLNGILEVFFVFFEKKSGNIDDLILIVEMTLLVVIFTRGGKGKLKRLGTFLQVFISLGMSIMFFSALLVQMINPNEALVEIMDDAWDISNYDYLIAIMILSVYGSYLYFKVYKKGIFLQFSKWQKWVIMIFSIYIWLISARISNYIVVKDYIDIPLEFRCYFIIAICFMYIFVPAFFVKNRVSEWYEKGQKHHKELLELELEHFSKYKEQQEETRRFRHDILNHLNAIESLIKTDKTEKAKEYVGSLLSEVSELSQGVVTGDEMLDCIVSQKWETMKKKNINFYLEGVLDKGLKWEAIDICGVFANALDNAIEACEKVEEEKEIYMHLKKTNSFYSIEIKNSMVLVTDKFKLEKRFTTKEDKALHGFGLENICRTVNKYGGTVSTECVDNHFVLNLIVPSTY
ncbi:MAG: GHKL domain-containing protein [Lachnospiraceae bacterium]|nr:GHKL domain-containing protein [Lachnospiraceae bacterium]